jgi:cytochrome b involved in lipid metabolism
MLKFKSQEELEAYVKQSGKVLVIKDGDVLDVTTFARHHPGIDF